jgi:broad specificity phosphatase PhoE
LCSELKITTIHIESRLAERCYGDAEGLTIDEARRRYPNVGDAPSSEDSRSFNDRVKSALNSLMEEKHIHNALIVTHAEVIATAYGIIGVNPGYIEYASLHQILGIHRAPTSPSAFKHVSRPQDIKDSTARSPAPPGFPT